MTGHSAFLTKRNSRKRKPWAQLRRPPGGTAGYRIPPSRNSAPAAPDSTRAGRERDPRRVVLAAGAAGWQDRGVPGRPAAFDELDERIVAVLVGDARASYADIGASVGLSASAVKRRVDRLRASGAITGFTVTVDPSALGWTTEAYVELFCRGRTSPSAIGAALSKYPEVTGACTITGEADALLHIRAADVRHFEQVVERIGAESFVVRTRSVIVLSRLVNRPDLLTHGGSGQSG
jgi:DNA-binding Lrp family transcriptional regulator